MSMLRCLRASQAFRSAPRSTSKSFSRWRDKRGFLMQPPQRNTHEDAACRSGRTLTA